MGEAADGDRASPAAPVPLFDNSTSLNNLHVTARSASFRVAILSRCRDHACGNERKLPEFCTSVPLVTSTRCVVDVTPKCKTPQFRIQNVGPQPMSQNETLSRAWTCISMYPKVQTQNLCNPAFHKLPPVDNEKRRAKMRKMERA